MLALVLLEIAGLPAERSRGRHNPRVVKRKMSNFPTRSRAEPAQGGRLRYEQHVRIVPPAVPEPNSTASVPCQPQERTKPVAPERNHLQHVQAWHTGSMSRADYCRRHGLDPKTFNNWVARSRNYLRRKAPKTAAQA